MAPTNTPKTAPESDENLKNGAKPLFDQAIREFVESKFENDAEGEIKYFDGFFQNDTNKNRVFADFKSFLLARDGYKTLADKELNAGLFAFDIQKVGYSIENLKKSVRASINSEYSFGDKATTDAMMKNIEAVLKENSLRGLRGLAQSPKERVSAVKKALKKAGRGAEVSGYRKSIGAFLSTLKRAANITDADIATIRAHADELKNVRAAFANGLPTDDDLKIVIGLLTDTDTKRSLMKAFLPSVSLGELVEAKVVSKKEARAMLVERIFSESAGNPDSYAARIRHEAEKAVRTDDPATFALNGGALNAGQIVELEKRARIKARDLAEGFDLENIHVDTAKLDVDQIKDSIIFSKLATVVTEQVDRGFEDIKGALEGDFEVSKIAGDRKAVIKKIVEEFGPTTVKTVGKKGGQEDAAGKSVPGIEKLLDDSKTVHFEGFLNREPDANGNRTAIRFRIVGWNDAAQPGKPVEIENLDEKGQKVGDSEKISHSQLYRLISSVSELRAYDEIEYGKALRFRDKNLSNVGDTAWRDDENLPQDERERKEAELEAKLSEEIPSIEELIEKLDEIDSDGKDRGFKEGVGFTIGEPGKTGYNVFTILKIEGVGAEAKVRFRNTKPEGSNEEIMSIGMFFFAVRNKDFKRTAPADSALNVLSLLSGALGLASKYEGMTFDSDTKTLVPKSRQDERDYEGVKYLVGKDKKTIEIGMAENGRIQLRMVKDFEKGDPQKNVPPQGEAQGDFVWCGYETLYQLIRTLEAAPFEGLLKMKPPVEPEFESQGRIKKFINHASFHDFMHGLQEIPKFVKEKFAHSSHHHAAHVTLAMAEKIPGFPADWLVDLQQKIHAEDKGTLEKEIERLNSFPSPHRHKQVLKYLLNKGSHDYETIAGMLSLLEKHGNLYPGPLAKYEKDWLFFWRMPGGDHHDKEAWLQKMRTGENGEKKEFKEVDAIMLWLKERADDHHHPINPHYWLQVKKRWNSGSSAEFEMWGKESESKETFLERQNYALSKFRGKEYAHGVGAMEKIWSKPSENATDRMTVPFVLAMSNIRDHLHPNLTQKFVGMFDDGHTYPPLLFIQTPDRQALFRRIIEKLCSDGGEMGGDFARIQKLMFESRTSIGDGDKNKKDEALILGLESFWKKHGRKLGRKLFVSIEDPEILLRKEEDADFAKYVDIVGEEIGSLNKLDEAELSMGLYASEKGANPALLNPKAYVGRYKVNPGNAGLNGELEKVLAKEYVKSINLIKEAPIYIPAELLANAADTPEQAREKKTKREKLEYEAKFMLYKRYHHAFINYVYDTVSPTKWRNSGPNSSLLEIEGEGWIQDATKVGMSFKNKKEEWPSEDRHEDSEKYKAWAKKDFEKFMGGTTTESASVAGHTSAKVSEVINKPTLTEDDDWRIDDGDDEPSDPAPAPVPPTPGPSTPPETVPNEPVELELVSNFKEKYEPVRDRIEKKFGGDSCREHLKKTSEFVSNRLKAAGVSVPEDISNGEWAAKTLLTRFAEWEKKGVVGNAERSLDDLLGTDEILEKIGASVLREFEETGFHPEIDFEDPGEHIHYEMLFLENREWMLGDYHFVGEMIATSA